MDVYFDLSHGEEDVLLNDEEKGYSVLVESLEEMGISFHKIEDNLSSTLNSLPPKSVLWVSCPKTPFKKEDVIAILYFLKGGGSALFLAEWGDMYQSATILNRVLKFLRVRFNTDVVMDVPLEERLTKKGTDLREEEDLLEDLEIELEIEDGLSEIGTLASSSFTPSDVPTARLVASGSVAAGEGWVGAVPHASSYKPKEGGSEVTEIIKVRAFKDHPITKEVSEVVIDAGCSLSAPKECILAFASEKSFGDRDMNRRADEGEEVGNIPVAAVVSFHIGKVVCIGDTSLASNKYISCSDNFRFLSQVFRWLGE